MKKTFFLTLFLLGLLAGFTSCQKEPSLTLSGPASLELQTDGGSGTISFTANRDWTVRSSDPWITLYPTSGKASDGLVAVSVRCQANTTYDDRSATVTISMEGLSQTVTVTQPANLGIILPTQSYDLTDEARSIEVTVQANVGYSVAISDSWIKQTGTKGLTTDKLTFSVEQNESYDARSATITVKPQNATVQEQVISVKQAQKDGLIVDKTAFEVAYGGGEIEVKVDANVDFDVTPAAGWIHHLETKALRSSTVRLSVDANPTAAVREGQVEIKQANGTLHYTLTVKQAARIAVTSITLDKTDLSLREGESATLTATVKPDNTPDKGVAWSSADPAVATVDHAGTVTAVAQGSTTITAQAGDKTATCQITVTPSAAALERAALEAFYKATGGDGWKDNSGWLTDAPLSSWSGLAVNDAGHVTHIRMRDNNLSGTLPPEIGDFPYLEELILGSYEVRTKLGGTIPEQINKLTNLKNLSLLGCDFVGKLPSMADMTSLTRLDISECNQLDVQPLPASIGNARGMAWLQFRDSNFTGPLPDTWASFSQLEYLFLAEMPLNCTVPAYFKNFTKLEVLYISDSGLHGVMPAELSENPRWWKLWPNIVVGNNFTDADLAASQLPAPPQLKLTARDGNTVDLDALIKSNKYTLLHSWDINFPDCIDFMKKLRRYYLQLSPGDMAVVGTFCSNMYEAADVKAQFSRADEIVAEYNIPWPQIYDPMYSDNRPYGDRNGAAGYPYGSINEVLVFDTEGHLVWTSLNNRRPLAWLDRMVAEFGLSADYYASTDYSRDGEVKQLQKATEGNGVDIVLMGDGFTDRLIADGTYDARIQEMLDGIFSEEPTKSLRHLFNVYSVTAVSKNEEYDGDRTQTALGGGFGIGSYCFGNDEAALGYARKAVGDDRMDEVLCVVVLNQKTPSGTCFMKDPVGSGDYGNGAAVAYFGIGDEEFGGYGDATIKELVLHEAVGHGLAKLGDEYVIDASGWLTDHAKEDFQAKEKSGWYKNLSLTGDPEKVKWAAFLKDSRYAGENLGVYEGGYTAGKGVWRPSEDSIMNSTKGGFNAPSRAAIYYRIHKLAYGASWTYDYETFVTWDQAHR